MKIYYDSDADPAALAGAKITILGYGSQGHAHAQNLRDSGYPVRVGLRPGSASRTQAMADGFEVLDPVAAVQDADVVMVLIPDHDQAALFASGLTEALKPGCLLLFAHGFSIHYGTVFPPRGCDVAMVAPKAPGHMVRSCFRDEIGCPALLAIQQDSTGHARERSLAYARGLGSTKAGVLETTFREETETDLFGEQAVLCGGVAALITAAFETLTQAGYQPELAYFECLHELKLIVDLIYQGGLSLMRYSVSDTAEYGDYTSGPVVIDEHVKEQMRGILGRIQDGSFAEHWIDENRSGRKGFLAQRETARTHPIEEVGQRLRAQMSWIHPVAAVPKAASADPGQQAAAAEDSVRPVSEVAS
ncbi:MAG TPA: ketol-acid reductoisomerase [Candidatus Dormibacteraeota bacterium]|nr:ketol-acid reductoisomerase [Candidatus Dormibacteraeota bacterium]